MTDEKLKFKDMLLNIKVIDSNDKVRKLADCVESEFEELVSKITEYNQDGEITIKLKLKCDKKIMTSCLCCQTFNTLYNSIHHKSGLMQSLMP